MIPAVFFYILALGTVVFALMVISARNPIYSAMALLGCLLTIAGIYALNSAHLVAVFQIGVYAGAIVVMILIILNLLNLSPKDLSGSGINTKHIARATAGAYMLGVIGVILLIRLVSKPPGSSPAVSGQFGTIKAVSMVLFTKYLLPFELISFLLLAAMIGALIIIQKDKGE